MLAMVGFLASPLCFFDKREIYYHRHLKQGIELLDLLVACSLSLGNNGVSWSTIARDAMVLCAACDRLAHHATQVN
jgi:hypothetical protein